MKPGPGGRVFFFKNSFLRGGSIPAGAGPSPLAQVYFSGVHFSGAVSRAGAPGCGCPRVYMCACTHEGRRAAAGGGGRRRAAAGDVGR
jgi:hypothetical protein